MQAATSKYIGLLISVIIPYSLYSQEMNQFQYHPKSVKYIFAGPEYSGKSFSVFNKDGSRVTEGRFSDKNYWEFSGTYSAMADLTGFNEKGLWTIKSGSNLSAEFEISPSAYLEVGRALLKSFYYARASMPVEKEFGGIYARPAGHPDDKVLIHRSAASGPRPEGTVISCPGGWYDAGDYNKYIVNSGITVFTLLHLYESFPYLLDTLTLNIPESTDSNPDILDETLYNLNWMLSMQDPNDGGVYHKLTNKNFGGMIMPHMHNFDRYVVMKTTAASLDFAAVMAKAYRVYRNLDQAYPGFADLALKASLKAYDWAKNNPEEYYKQPDDIKTGEYGDNSLSDEWFWASLEIYISTGRKEYINRVNVNRQNYMSPQWKRVNLLPLWSLSISAEEGLKGLKEKSAKQLVNFADKLIDIFEKSAFRIPANTFEWGSNSDLANNALVLVHAYLLTGERKYLDGADAAAGYLLGANPLAYSFITGFGSNYPKHLHDRRMVSDGIDEPVPGLLAGGPTNKVQSDCGEELYKSDFPAMSYIDMECSYSTNEIAINWNSAAAALFLSLDAIFNHEDK